MITHDEYILMVLDVITEKCRLSCNISVNLDREAKQWQNSRNFPGHESGFSRVLGNIANVGHWRCMVTQFGVSVNEIPIKLQTTCICFICQFYVNFPCLPACTFFQESSWNSRNCATSKNPNQSIVACNKFLQFVHVIISLKKAVENEKVTSVQAPSCNFIACLRLSSIYPSCFTFNALHRC